MSENQTTQVKVELYYLNLCCLSSALEVAAFVISAVTLAGVSGRNGVVMLMGFFIYFILMVWNSE